MNRNETMQALLMGLEADLAFTNQLGESLRIMGMIWAVQTALR